MFHRRGRLRSFARAGWQVWCHYQRSEPEAKALQAELEAELQASASEAGDNATRSRELREKGFYSPQMNTQYQTARHTALARLVPAAEAHLPMRALSQRP